MNNKEILENAIFQAEKNGYIGHNLDYAPLYKAISEDEAFQIKVNYTIFSHDFAKAFWGKEHVDDRFGESQNEWVKRTGAIKNWGCHKLRYQFHLQQIVLCKEPLKYLKKFLNVKKT